VFELPVPQFCTCRLPWFGLGDRHSWGPVEHLRDHWERISVLHQGCIESSVVHTQPQSAVLLSLFRDFVDTRNLCGSSRPGYLVISSHALPMLLEPKSLFLTNTLWMPWKVRCESCRIFGAYVQIVVVSHEHTTILDIVKFWYCAGMRPPSSVTISTLTMSVPILVRQVCIVSCFGRVELGRGPGLAGSDGSWQ